MAAKSADGEKVELVSPPADAKVHQPRLDRSSVYFNGENCHYSLLRCELFLLREPL